MGQHYQHFVDEVLRTALREGKTATGKKIKVYLRDKNRHSFYEELRRQCMERWPELVVESVRDVEVHLENQGASIEINQQCVLTDDYSYVRYEVDHPTIIFADYDQ